MSPARALILGLLSAAVAAAAFALGMSTPPATAQEQLRGCEAEGRLRNVATPSHCRPINVTEHR